MIVVVNKKPLLFFAESSLERRWIQITLCVFGSKVRAIPESKVRNIMFQTMQVRVGEAGRETVKSSFFVGSGADVPFILFDSVS